jgi:uncharacterized Zn-finger protein
MADNETVDSFSLPFEVEIAMDAISGQKRPKSSSITFQRSCGTVWKLSLVLRSFEAIHGMSRVVKLVPDKLATAMEINRENIPDDDGHFLIKLVKKLAVFYQSLVISQANEDESEDDRVEEVLKIVSDVELDIFFAEYNFREIIGEFFRRLDSFEKHLIEREDELESKALMIVNMSDDILACCHIFMDFVHPVWLDIQRKGEIDYELVLTRKMELFQKLSNNHLRLEKEFLELVAEYEQIH